MSRFNPDEAPAYCMICNVPIPVGPVCAGCAEWPDEGDYDLEDPPDEYEPSPYDGTYSED